MLPNQFQQGAKYREGLAAPSMQEPMAFAILERQRSLHYFVNHVLYFLRNIGCSLVRAEKDGGKFPKTGTNH
jgi:hypothetical protein